MLLPILHNHRLLRRIDRNPEYVIKAQRLPPRGSMDVAKFKEFVKDPINGQVYKFVATLSDVEKQEAAWKKERDEIGELIWEDEPTEKSRYYMWLEGYGQSGPAEYTSISRNFYHDIAITPPFANRTSDIEMAILLYGLVVRGRERMGGLRGLHGVGVDHEEMEADVIDKEHRQKSALEWLSNNMMYMIGHIDSPTAEKTITLPFNPFRKPTEKEKTMEFSAKYYESEGNQKAIAIWEAQSEQERVWDNVEILLLGDYRLVMDTAGYELAPDAQNYFQLLDDMEWGEKNRTKTKTPYNWEGYLSGELSVDKGKEIMELFYLSPDEEDLTPEEREILAKADKEIAEQEKPPLEKFLDEKEESLDQEVAKGKKEKVSTREKEFTEPKQICPHELKDATTDAAYSETDTFVKQDVHSEVTTDTINKAQESKNQILASPEQVTIPADATYQYTLRETSEMYNKTIDREEMEAYFYAHPQLDHIRKEVIGDYIHDKEELMQIGLLLYNPSESALAYRYEYLKGNVYDLLEQYTDDANKNLVVQEYDLPTYENQLKIMEEAKPPIMSIDDTDVSKVPFIHPLTEQIVSYTLIATKSKIYTPPQKDPTIPANPLKLSILVFFMDWVNEQTHRLNEFGLTYMEEIRMLYFKATSFKRFKEWFENKSLPVKIDLAESMYIERKDSAKRMVNTLFQDFLKNELEDEDRKSIDYIFNKNFNGYVEPNTEKLPIFIRHSKYFKNFKKFQLSSIQIKSAKFSTLNNSSILAHEVGYGKTLASLAFMSHMFETNQAHNIFTVIPKTLYENNKWKEEAIGKTDADGNPIYDKASNGYVIGAFPMYNLIGVGNLREKMVYNGGKGGLKEYTKQEIKNITAYEKILRVLNKPSAQPTSFVTPPREWQKILVQLGGIDKTLYDKFLDKEMEALLGKFVRFSKKPTKLRKDPRTLDNLIDTFIQEGFMEWWALVSPAEPFKPNIFKEHKDAWDKHRQEAWGNVRKQVQRKIYQEVRKKQKLAGKKIKKYGKTQTQRKATHHQIRMAFLTQYLEEIHEYVEGLANKMRGYSIYQYGKFTFKQGDQNIILATREALDNVGFSVENIENVQETVQLVTSYLNEGKIIGEQELESQVELEFDDAGDETHEWFKGTAQKTLQSQLEEMLSIILNKMTEAGATGKFELEQLNIDGFILDEAHMAKKLFTRVKTDSSVQVVNEKGKVTKIRYSSHDIGGGKPPLKAMKVFGITAYIHSLKGNKPVMFLTATPFTNHPTEIFSMLAMVGMKQLRGHGLSNIKNFFDMFIKETLKYDFNHKGEYVKKVVIEDFRNKNKLRELIWSIMDIRRGAGDSPEDREMAALKPQKSVIPRFNGDSLTSDEDEADDISTIILNRATPVTSSIIDRNKHQVEMLDNIEKWLNGEVTEQSICPKFQLFTEFEEQTRQEREELLKEMGEDLGEEFVINNVEEDDAMTKKITGRTGFGKTFKALGMARSICLSPYFYQCNDLPFPTPEDFVKYSPKIEYVIKCLKSVKDYHIKKGEQVSGQVIYTNMLNFKYTYKDPSTGKIYQEQFNLAKLIRQYLIDEQIFDEDEVDIIASGVKPKFHGKSRSREVQIKDFQQGRTKVLIGSPAIREGVDLQHNASVLYILTPDWNPTDMRQVEGRIWRRDNRFAKIRVVYALMDNSIEVFIYAKLEEKARRLEKVMKERNAVEELEEMSLDPKLTKVALVSDPEKRADVIVKEEELETKSRLSVLYRDDAMVDNVLKGMSALDAGVKSMGALFFQYQTIREKISNEVADYQVSNAKKLKVSNPQKLVDSELGYVFSFHSFTTKQEREGTTESGSWAKRNQLTPLTDADVKEEIERRRVVWGKKKREILESMARTFVDHAIYDEGDTRQKRVAGSKKMSDAKLEEELIKAIKAEREKENKEMVLKAYDYKIKEAEEHRFDSTPKLVYDSQPLNQQASAILSMMYFIDKLRRDFSQLGIDTQNKIKDPTTYGKLPYPTLFSILTQLGPKAQSKKNSAQAADMDTVLSGFRIIQRAYLDPRGMTISDVPTLSQEIKKEIGDKEKTISKLDQKRLDLIYKFEEDVSKRQDYDIDDLITAFSKTNEALQHKFPIKD